MNVVAKKPLFVHDLHGFRISLYHNFKMKSTAEHFAQILLPQLHKPI